MTDALITGPYLNDQVLKTFDRKQIKQRLVNLQNTAENTTTRLFTEALLELYELANKK